MFKKLIPIFLSLLIFVSCGAYEPEGASGGFLEPEAPAVSELTEPAESEVGEPVETEPEVTEPAETEPEETEPTEAEVEETKPTEAESEALPDWLPVEGEYYYDVENVVLYLVLYGELPPNYITKDEARELGWEGGSVEDYLSGAAIGGDRFSNREGILPEKRGREYTECDIDTDGYYSRGSRRLVFSNDGLYFYTRDHYETFSEVEVTEDYEVIW